MKKTHVRADFRFLDRLRVRWAEIDAQKIVFSGHYLMYFDTAVAGYWRALALPYAQSMESLEGDLYVRKATVEYHASALFDDLIDVGIRCERIGSSSMTVAAAVFRGDALLVSGELVYVFADPRTQTSRPVPPRLREILGAFEAGEAMIDVQLRAWSEARAEALALRNEVFVGEQGIPASMAGDDADAGALHALARNRLGLVLAAGRLLAPAPGVARIGRMAVLRAQRGSGVGRAVLDALLAAARDRGDREAVLSSQATAVAFYRRAGFVPVGPAFTEAGIVHQEMKLAL
ncbi:MAG: YbgC/FadM family acyl-CoA thioesterase [Ideonella sp.]|nr:YbgC/FadM family acyl-CoA thioesterase [Ideonella sp.]